MPRSEEIQEHVREKVIELHESGKGYKSISKALGLNRSTARAIVHKWRTYATVVNLPKSGRPTKITPSAQQKLIQEVTKNPRRTSRELQASLASLQVRVHDSTIRKTLGRRDLHRAATSKPQRRNEDTEAGPTSAENTDLTPDLTSDLTPDVTSDPSQVKEERDVYSV